MDILLTKCAGLDVHREQIVVCTLIGESDEYIQKEIKTFPTMTKDLYLLLQWLENKGITHLAMESTGVYWKPVFNILEDFFDITLANAQRIKNVPGKKTDVSDAEWIAKLLRYGLIEKSFVPPRLNRELRDLTRLRKKLLGNLTSEKNRILKVLESSNVKLNTVISDVFGVSGRKLLETLISKGYVEFSDVMECIHHRLNPKVSMIVDSLFGTLTPHQIFLIKQSWNHLLFIEQSIQDIEEQIDGIISDSFNEEAELLLTVPGLQKNTIATIIAEIGVDMDQFATAKHLSSWAGLSPGNNESAGKKKVKKS
ncbi:MAG: family transposase [Bacillales bacterium]|jgi:transposase|nr:family transposase [Bacillales bacterium]